jgi:hypothetical protein
MQRFWGVTTLIDHGLPKQAQLVPWGFKTAAEYAVENVEMLSYLVREGKTHEALDLIKKSRWRRSGEAMARGSEVHAAAEAINLGQRPDVPEHIKPYVEHYRAFLAEHRPTFEMAEAPVYSLTWHYAGTLDAIVVIDGRRCVLEMKTTDKRPGGLDGSRPPYPEVALQLCAYSRADGVGLNPERVTVERGRRYYVLQDESELEPMPEIEGAFALVVSPYDYVLVPVDIGEETWRTFLHVREVARWSLETSRSVLGPPVGRAAA